MNTKVRTIVALLVLAFLIGLVAALWRPAATGLAQLWSPLPTPTPDMWPFPTSTPWVPTPWPTFTPRPTPTRQPGPTATPFPLRGPAADAAGTILYQADVMMALPVDGRGQAAAEAQPLRWSLNPESWLDSVSPDGRYLIMLSPSMPGGIPYVFDTQTQQAWLLFRGDSGLQEMSGWTFGWHPDSRQVLFWSDGIALWLVNVETGEYTTLAFVDGPLQGAAISPDGQQIVYIARSDLSRRTIWVVSAAGSDARPLLDLGGSPSRLYGWSPDGAYILYAGGPNDFSYEDLMAGTPSPGGPLRLIDPQGRHVRYLQGHFLFGWAYGAAWSPDSQWVAFTGPDPGQPFGCADGANSGVCRYAGVAVYIENVYSGEIRRLAAGGDPTWSPDGSMLAFLSAQSGAVEVWTVRIDGSELQQLTSDGRNKSLLFWAPAGR